MLKQKNWVTIDGNLFSEVGKYYTGIAPGTTLKLSYFTSQGAYITHSIPHWNDIYSGETAVTLIGGIFSVDFDSPNRNGPLWAKGVMLEVLGHT